MSEHRLVDKFFTAFKNVVKTYGIFYHLAENRHQAVRVERGYNLGSEDNEFLQLSIYTVMELIQGASQDVRVFISRWFSSSYSRGYAPRFVSENCSAQLRRSSDFPANLSE
jgi:hypothetical protein